MMITSEIEVIERKLKESNSLIRLADMTLADSAPESLVRIVHALENIQSILVDLVDVIKQKEEV